MAEEKPNNNTTPTSDDMDVLRILLHNIKGISSVSTVGDMVPLSELSE